MFLWQPLVLPDPLSKENHEQRQHQRGGADGAKGAKGSSEAVSVSERKGVEADVEGVNYFGGVSL